MNVESEQQLQSLHGDSSPVVLHFWATWCEPCKHMDVVMTELSKDFPAVKFARVEAEEVDALTELYGVTSVPTFVFLKGSKCMGKLEGAHPQALTAELHKHYPVTAAASSAPPHPDTAEDAISRIKSILAAHPIVLFMKGSAAEPRCGFSRKVVGALKALNAPFHTVDILQDPELREQLKVFSNWPTFPQLYVDKALVGGCDIVLEMQLSGELKELLEPWIAQAAIMADMDPVITSTPPPPQAKTAAPPAASQADVKLRIQALLKSAPVLLFMKGSPDAPQCGFSRKVVDALNASGIEFQHFDILKDEAIRQGLKEYSNWPTYPQVYVNGELLGGCDILMEMQANNELKSTVAEMLGPNAAPAEDLNTRLKKLTTQKPVMVFMKGTPQQPRCGFSSRVVQMLQSAGIDFGSFDILTDEEVRQGLKELSKWPTYPQVYVKGELLGGCDIMTELHNNNELKTSIDEMLLAA